MPLKAELRPAALRQRMIGHVGTDLKPESDLEQFQVLAERRRLQATGQDNPYKRRFLNFLLSCVWTKDEARAGLIKPWPRGPGRDGRDWTRLWLEMEDVYLRAKLLMLEKSRRVLASWFTCAFDVWIAGGGQDPRWLNSEGDPVLMGSDRNRNVIVAARKAKGLAGSEWFIAERIRCILEGFEEHGGRELWPDFPTWEHTCNRIDFSNGSKIVGVPQGADQTRGAAATVLHCEEVAFWERAAETVGAAIPTMRGGGHIILVTTPQVGTYCADIRAERLRQDV